MVCYIPGCVCYGSDKLGFGTQHYYYFGLADATTNFYTENQYQFDYRFVDE